MSSACLRLPRSEGCTATVDVVEAGADHRLDLLGAQHLLEDRPVGAGEHQSVHGVLVEPEPAVARHRLGDVDEQRVRDGVPAVGEQGVDDLLGVVAGGARVPQAERGEPVGVHVLRGPLELGERRDGLAAVLGPLVVDLEQQGLVGLDDQRTLEASPAYRRVPSRRRSAGCPALALPGAVGGDVGARRAPVRAVAAGLVGRGVDEDVGAGAGVADARAGWRRGRRPGSTAPSATRRPAARRPRTRRSATCRCHSASRPVPPCPAM